VRRAPDEIGRRGLDERSAEALLPIIDATRHLALDVVHELIHLTLHLFDLAPQVENDFHAGQIHTEIAREREDRLELFEILFGVEAVLPSVRDGLSRPSRSYKRSVCGWMSYFCDTALIM
jgi:hypothetical protein